MGWSNGTYSRVHNWTADEAAAIDIEASRMDAEDDSIEAGINNCLTKDGQNEPTTNLPMDGNRHTGVGNAAALTDYASAADVIDQHLTYYVDSGSANTYVITPSPSIGAYAEGQKLVFRAANTNTGASTLNVNALGAFAIQTNDGQALSGGEIVAGGYYEVVYDANSTPDRFVLVSPSSRIGPITKRKGSPENVTSSTTLQDDDALAGWTLENGAIYRLTAKLIYTQNGGDLNIKLNFSNAPVSASDHWSYYAYDENGNTVFDVALTMGTNALITTMADTKQVKLTIDAYFQANLTTGGTVDLQWAQALSSANATTMLAGSWIDIEKLD